LAKGVYWLGLCVDRDLNPGCRLGRPKSYL
jgi:hypothetical protein